MLSRRLLTSLALVLGATSTLIGCATGPRPTLGPTTTFAPITDSAIVSVVDLLTVDPTAPFSITYDVLTKFGNKSTSAQVTFDPKMGTATLIGTTLYVIDEQGTARTCSWSEATLSVLDCSAGIDETRVSDTQLNSRSFKSAAVDRLRRDAAIAVGPATATQDSVAEHPSTCSAIPVIDSNGAQQKKLYCVFPTLGMIAKLETADLSITAVFVDDAATLSLFNDETA